MSQKLGIKVNIIEAEDGVEALYLVYKCFTQGVRISLILSDEHMVFMKGSWSADLIKEFLEYKNMNSIPFYLVTANDKVLPDDLKDLSLNKILPKPLSQDVAKELIKECLNK